LTEEDLDQRKNWKKNVIRGRTGGGGWIGQRRCVCVLCIMSN
jgi:hypothetical protein